MIFSVLLNIDFFIMRVGEGLWRSLCSGLSGFVESGLRLDEWSAVCDSMGISLASLIVYYVVVCIGSVSGCYSCYLVLNYLQLIKIGGGNNW